jgi:hypothetical protein
MTTNITTSTSNSLQIVEFQRQVDGLFFGSGWHLSSTAMFEYPNSTAMAQLINTELFSNNSNSKSAMASQHSSGPLSISVYNNEHTTAATANTSTDNADTDAGNDSSDDDEVKAEVGKTEPVQNAVAQHLAPLTVTPQPQRRRSSVQCQQGSPAPLAMLSPAGSSNGCVTASNGGSGMSPVVTPTSETVGSGRKMSVVTTAAPGGAMPYTQAEVRLMCMYITRIVTCVVSAYLECCMRYLYIKVVTARLSVLIMYIMQ